MASHRMWKVTRDTIVHETDGTGNIIHVESTIIGGSNKGEVCEDARRQMPVIEAQYSVRELTDAEYAAYYKGEQYVEPKTEH